MATLDLETIKAIAFETTGQRTNPYWRDLRKGKLTASKFGRAYRASINENLSAIETLKQDIYNPRDLSHIKPIQWGIEHEAEAIDEYIKETSNIVKPTGLWLFPCGVLGASPDGLVYRHEHDMHPIGIVEVKCPYSIRDKVISCENEWHAYLKYLDCFNNLRRDHDYYAQIQGTMAAVGVEWCDFFVWTPDSYLLVRIPKDVGWQKTQIERFTNFYYKYLERKEDLPPDQQSNDTEDFDLNERCSTCDIGNIMHPVGQAEQCLRNCI